MKYELMRISRIKSRYSFFLDLYNSHYKKNIELHYSSFNQRYNYNLLDNILHCAKDNRKMLSLDEWDNLVEKCKIQEVIK